MSGAESREGLGRRLRECGGGRWGGAGRRGGARAGQVGEDGLDGEGILHRRENGWAGVGSQFDSLPCIP